MAKQPTSNTDTNTAVKSKATAARSIKRRTKKTRKRSGKRQSAAAKDAEENTSTITEAPPAEKPQSPRGATDPAGADTGEKKAATPSNGRVGGSAGAAQKDPAAKKTRRRRKRKIRSAAPAGSADDTPPAEAVDPEPAAESANATVAGAPADEAPKSADRKRRRKRKRKKSTEARPAAADAADAPADASPRAASKSAPAPEAPAPARTVTPQPATAAATTVGAPTDSPRPERSRKSAEPFGAGLMDDDPADAFPADSASPAASVPTDRDGRRLDADNARQVDHASAAHHAMEHPALPEAAPRPALPAHTDADELPADSGATAASKLVLKRRPKRRAGRGRRRGRGDGERERDHEESPEKRADREATASDRSADRPQKPQATPPADAKKRDEKKAEEPKKRRRKRATKRTKAQQPTAAPEIKVIGEKDAEPVPPPATGAREMIINVTAGAECRIAILHEGRLEELYIERQSAGSHVGNIYKGIVTNVEPSIQAAFIDFGLNKNGFLHISDVRPRYFPGKTKEPEPVGKKVPRRDRPPIQKCFRRGDEVIVQVAKEGVGTKGPTLTTYLSIPGRFMVMMPGMNRLGVSRKIEDENDRRTMRELLHELALPEDMGFILRTAGLNRTKRELQGDLNYLQRLWKTVEQRIKAERPPCELYQESDLVIRTIRDIYTSDFARIIVDDADTAQKAKAFLQIAMPRSYGEVVEYRRYEPIFHFYGIENEIQQIHSRHVPLPSGGSIVIDTTEAMVAIDVNSGKYRELADAEETAYRTNLEAAEEIARQLRLRDLGGLVVCDFIDMRLDRHKRAVEKALRDALKKHKERARILRLSKFGLIEMTRQRQRPSIKRSVFNDCPHCNGSGLIKTPESVSLEVMRILQLLIHKPEVHTITLTAAPAVSTLVLNDRRSILHQMEKQTSKRVRIQSDATFARDQVSYECADDRGMPLRIEV